MKSIKSIIPIAVLLLSLTACRTVRTVEQVPVHDTLHVFHTDSTHTTDSIFIERHTTVREADSALLAEYGIRLAEGERALLVLRRELERASSSTSSVKADTVFFSVEKPVPYPVVEYKEKPFRWWQKDLMWTGGLVLATALVAVAVRLRRR